MATDRKKDEKPKRRDAKNAENAQRDSARPRDPLCQSRNGPAGVEVGVVFG
jgi:hypothetical protein